MAEKIALFVQLMTNFVGGFIVAFIYGWQMTLVMLTITPLLVITGAVTTKVRQYNRQVTETMCL
jgi:ATP-binding cassette subfamily B (MDR/TAP) protein 1